jgi:hypothetical protein
MPVKRVKTGLVRFTFVHLAEPYSYNDAPNPKYSLSILIDKEDHKTLELIKKNYQEAKQEGVEKYGQMFANKATPLKRQPGTISGILVDCDEDERYMGNKDFKGHYLMSAKSTTAPDVCIISKGTVMKLQPEQIKEEVYSGCYGKITFNFYPYSRTGTGIACGLSNVLKKKDGEFMGGRVSGATDFADEVEEDDDDDLF